MSDVDAAAAILRAALALTMFAHGWNHAFGGGRLTGTARWFESIGLRPGALHAILATGTELGSALLLTLGLFTTLAAAAVVGTMLVALITNHLKNGFFIFRPGEGYEYVLFVALSAAALGVLGAGRLSLDSRFDIQFSATARLIVVGVIGVGGAGMVLATSWRPGRDRGVTS